MKTFEHQKWLINFEFADVFQIIRAVKISQTMQTV